MLSVGFVGLTSLIGVCVNTLRYVVCLLAFTAVFGSSVFLTDYFTQFFVGVSDTGEALICVIFMIGILFACTDVYEFLKKRGIIKW